MPILITWSDSFFDDIESLADGVFQNALDHGEAPSYAEDAFREDLRLELIRVLSLIQINPFKYQAYNTRTNPTRRGVIFNGNLILEHQLVPMSANQSSEVNEVILTALVASRSGIYNGAYDDIDTYNIDDIFI